VRSAPEDLPAAEGRLIEQTRMREEPEGPGQLRGDTVLDVRVATASGA
jgi:hypothetical protein